MPKKERKFTAQMVVVIFAVMMVIIQTFGFKKSK